jgi:beta-galactosidase
MTTFVPAPVFSRFRCRPLPVLLTLGALVVPLLFAANVRAQTTPRQRTPFNADWRFQKDDPEDAGGKLAYTNLRDWLIPTSNPFVRTGIKPTRPAGNPGGDVSYVQPNYDDNGWRRLNLPHDWGIEGPFKQEYSGETGKLPWWGIGWYRKRFSLPDVDKNKRIYLDIDGAMSYAAVWLNGKLVGGWPYGYSSFRVDLTPYIRPGGENVLAIRLDNPNDSSRWYPGGGIYRNVWLVKTAPVHVAHWGTSVTTPEVSSTAATVKVETTLSNDSDRASDVRLVSTLLDAGNKAVAVLTQSGIKLAPGQTQTVSGKISVPSPRLWSLKDPYRYRVVSRIVEGQTTHDRYETPFGIRTIAFDKSKGFLLNGQRVPLQGVCNHHDLGALGAAINTRALERQIEILQEMGCNAIRTSHNPPAPELLDLCDRMGILVMDELADVWKAGKKPNGYQNLFDDWSEPDLRALVRRDRNHPSVILWSTGNEIREQGSTAGADVSRRLTAIVHEEDPTRLVSLGANDVRAGYNGFQNTIDVFGYNYKPGEYAKFLAANPNIPLIGSETASTVSSRGEYFFPVTDNKDGGKADFQVSSYDLYAPSWAMPPDREFRGQDENPAVAGEFVWTGFDYLGEPTPYNSDTTNLLNFFDPAEKARAEQELKELGRIRVPSRSSYFGIVDLAGFKKDRFYLYQARWRPDFPMAHLLPHWNWPDRVGQVTPVHVYTSGDEAELFLNGTSLGRKKKAPLEYRLRWDDVVYAPGEVRVVAYKNGRPWANDTVKTTGPATKLLLKADRSTIKSDGSDLAFITVSIADQDGLMVPRTNNCVRFEIDGPGDIVATDNGDATSHASFQSPEREAYNGLALVIVRTRAGKSGPIRLKATSAGLTGAEITLSSRASVKSSPEASASK